MTTMEASDMLAAALEQMDGILARTPTVTSHSHSHRPPVKPPPKKTVASLLEELRRAVEEDTDAYSWERLPQETRDFFVDLLPNGTSNDVGYDHQNEIHEKMRRLENDKESLALQVSVLSEQVEAQNEKIRDMEVLVQHERGKASKVEEILQQEIRFRSSLESHKMDLTTEVNRLKLYTSNLEKEKFDMEKQLFKSESEIAKLHRAMEYPSVLSSQRGRRTPTQESNVEVEKMKKALESVMAANDEKDRKIDELRAAMLRYKRLQDKMAMTEYNKYYDNDVTDGVSSLGDWSSHRLYNNVSEPAVTPTELSAVTDKPPLAPRTSSSSFVTSTPQHGSKAESGLPPQVSPLPGLTRRSLSPPIGPRSTGTAASSVHGSSESVATVPGGQQVSSKQSPRRSEQHFGTVPRNYAPALAAGCALNEGSSSTLPCNASVASPRSKTSFGKGFLKSKSDSSRSSSAPNLAQTEMSSSKSMDGMQDGPFVLHSPEGIRATKTKGLKRILGKLKRSNSQSMEGEVLPEEFRRGGLRATAGSRLGWSQDLKGTKDSAIDVPFARWDAEKVMAWLHDLGLSSYISDCKRWVRNGDQLLKATPEDLEKELGIKNSLHRKKLTLALQAKGSDQEDEMASLDYHWVMRWLDDVGLPQYKDAFSDARIDGRMLHYLTVDDLTHLRVTCLLHAASLKQGIHILRLHRFNPVCLKRRSAPDESAHPPSGDVALWTNHRVMEWLRSVDLSEYAPNLRGSGVHGALMIYEDRFNAELLATLLSIPPTKTLLRRHLNMHFKELVGAAVMQVKRDCEAMPDHVPMTPVLKVKVVKRSQFSLMRKRSKSDTDDLLCPLDGTAGSPRHFGSLAASSPTGIANDCACSSSSGAVDGSNYARNVPSPPNNRTNAAAKVSLRPGLAGKPEDQATAEKNRL